MAGIKGDFALLQRKVTELAAVSTGFFEQVKKNAAAEALTQVQLGFRGARDPYGVPWKPNLHGGATLRQSGRLANSFTSAPTARGFEVGTNVLYAKAHQFGATIRAKGAGVLRFMVAGKWFSKKEVVIPQRRMVPDEGELGPLWSSAIEKVVDLVWRRFWKA
jgi:phage gpG-like protein